MGTLLKTPLLEQIEIFIHFYQEFSPIDHSRLSILARLNIKKEDIFGFPALINQNSELELLPLMISSPNQPNFIALLSQFDRKNYFQDRVNKQDLEIIAKAKEPGDIYTTIKDIKNILDIKKLTDNIAKVLENPEFAPNTLKPALEILKKNQLRVPENIILILINNLDKSEQIAQAFALLAPPPGSNSKLFYEQLALVDMSIVYQAIAKDESPEQVAHNIQTAIAKQDTSKWPRRARAPFSNIRSENPANLSKPGAPITPLKSAKSRKSTPPNPSPSSSTSTKKPRQ